MDVFAFDNLAITICIFILVFICGTISGSLLYYWAEFFVADDKSVPRKFSICPSCGQVLKFSECIPVLSWIFHRSRYTCCFSAMPVKKFVAELILGAVFCGIAAIYGLTAEAAQLALIACCLLFASIVNLETNIIYDAPLITAFFIRAAYIVFALINKKMTYAEAGDYLFCATVALFLLWLFIIVNNWFNKGDENIEGGVLKMFALGAFLFGWPQILLLILTLLFMGIVVAIASKKSQRLPLEPIVSLAFAFVALAGSPITAWYVWL